MNANNNNQEEVIREIPGPLVARQGREERPMGRYPVTLVRCKQMEILSKFTGAYEPKWVLEFEYLDQRGNTHSEWVPNLNSLGGKAHRLACGMSKDGQLDEAIRKDLAKFSSYFESKIGDNFEITLAPYKKGAKNSISDIRPLTEKEINDATDSIPF